MKRFRQLFEKYLPAETAAKDEAQGMLERLKPIHEMLADAVEGAKDLDLVEAVAQASPWAEAVGKSLGDALPPVRFVLKLFEHLTRIDDPGELGYLAATLTYQRAVEQAWPEVLRSEHGQKLVTPAPEVRRAALKELRGAAPAESYDFTRFSFRAALQHEFVRDADAFLETSARALGLDDAGFRTLQHQVHLRFVPNVKGILSHGETRERFRPFHDLLALDTEEARAYDALLEHADYQRWKFEEQCVLGREPFTLSQVYTETDCGVLTWGEITERRKEGGEHRSGQETIDPFSEKHGGRHPLVETVLDLLADADFKDAIVLQGVAGSGKSSLTLRLAWELVRQGLRPIRVELKQLDTSDRISIEESLPEAVFLTEPDRSPDATEVTFGKTLFLDGEIFKEHVLFRGARICPYVLILDGWDEISIGASEGYQQRVERMLSDLRRRYLEHRGVPLRIILAGRPTDAIEASKFLRSDTRILTVRNFSPGQLEEYVERVRTATSSSSASKCKDAGDGWDLSRVEALPKVLQRYRQVFGRGGMRQMEILGLPLLAHLALRLLAEQPESADEILDDTTALYRRLVDMVIAKAGKPEGADFDPEGTGMLAGHPLRKLLRGTAEAMTFLGVESLPHDELALRLGLEDDELPEKTRRLTGESALSRLLISFFFKGGRRELGAEFSHKSFREYLFAEQVIEELKAYGRRAPDYLPERSRDLYWKDFPENDPRHQLCHRLAWLLGPVWVTPEVSGHLKRLLWWEIACAAEPGREAEGQPAEALSLEEWRRVRDGIADAWDWWGDGVHLRPQPKRERGEHSYEHRKPLALVIAEDFRSRSTPSVCPTPPRTNTVDAHLGESLFLLAASCHAKLAAIDGLFGTTTLSCPARYIGPNELSSVGRRYQTVAQRSGQGSRLFRPSGPDQMRFFSYCSRVNAGGMKPLGPFPSGVDLCGVDLTGAMLAGLEMSRASFSGSILRRADLTRALLLGVDLINADLLNADLRSTVLDGSTLAGANLQGANFTGARLQDVDLSKANLRQADLRRADLCRAELRGADLTSAMLNGSFIDGASITKEQLQKTRRT